MLFHERFNAEADPMNVPVILKANPRDPLLHLTWRGQTPAQAQT